jgi:hypothetical protein
LRWRPRLNWSSVCSVNGLQCHTTANAHIGALSVSGALSQPSISDLAKENPGTTARWKMPGLIPSPHLQANAAGTRLARQSASRPCRCTTSDRDDAMRSNTPGGTYGRKAGPDAPLVCSTSGEYTRAALSKPRFAHHAGVIIPVHAAKPGDIRPRHIPAAPPSRKTARGQRPVARAG